MLLRPYQLRAPARLLTQGVRSTKETQYCTPQFIRSMSQKASVKKTTDLPIDQARYVFHNRYHVYSKEYLPDSPPDG